MTGQVYGKAGSSLNGAAFVANRQVGKIGAHGEQKSAKLLNDIAAHGPTVLHDLNVPAKYRANIDHVIVTGNQVVLIDTKAWAGAFYWTVAGQTYRGLKRFASKSKNGDTVYPAEKKTLPMARDAMAAYLGIPKHHVLTALIIWPTGKQKLSTWLFRSPGGAVVYNGETLTCRTLLRRFGKKKADPSIVSKLVRLVH